MLEVNVTVKAPELAEAILSLAAALSGAALPAPAPCRRRRPRRPRQSPPHHPLRPRLPQHPPPHPCPYSRPPRRLRYLWPLLRPTAASRS